MATVQVTLSDTNGGVEMTVSCDQDSDSGLTPAMLMGHALANLASQLTQGRLLNEVSMHSESEVRCH